MKICLSSTTSWPTSPVESLPIDRENVVEKSQNAHRRAKKLVAKQWSLDFMKHLPNRIDTTGSADCKTDT